MMLDSVSVEHLGHVFRIGDKLSRFGRGALWNVYSQKSPFRTNSVRWSQPDIKLQDRDSELMYCAMCPSTPIFRRYSLGGAYLRIDCQTKLISN